MLSTCTSYVYAIVFVNVCRIHVHADCTCSLYWLFSFHLYKTSYKHVHCIILIILQVSLLSSSSQVMCTGIVPISPLPSSPSVSITCPMNIIKIVGVSATPTVDVTLAIQQDKVSQTYNENQSIMCNVYLLFVCSFHCYCSLLVIREVWLRCLATSQVTIQPLPDVI